uniref:Uncharacterized protein n=1 Tax=Babesia bovis TaxID=5865 RepID=S6B5F1_BABBO|nr:hypothetical protein [Babesia bovis]
MEDTSYNESTVKLFGITASKGTEVYAAIGVGIVLILLAIALAVLSVNGPKGQSTESTSKDLACTAIAIFFLIGIPVLLLLILGGQMNLHLKRGRAIISSYYPDESYISKTLDGRLDINDVLLFIGYGLIGFGIVSLVGVSISVLASRDSKTIIAVFVSIVLGFLIIGIIMYTANPTLVKDIISGIFHRTAKKVAETESDSTFTSTK